MRVHRTPADEKIRLASTLDGAEWQINMSRLLEGSFPNILHFLTATIFSLIIDSTVLLVFDALDLARPGPIGLDSSIDFAIANCSCFLSK
jgi:hypothetical protein